MPKTHDPLAEILEAVDVYASNRAHFEYIEEHGTSPEKVALAKRETKKSRAEVVRLLKGAGLKCPRDNDGDGNCGQRYCPGCGEGRTNG